MASDGLPIAEMEMPLTRRFDVVLKPVSHPEIGDIRIESELFAIGRAEPPFASARAEIVAELSRRHAKLFIENGAAYIADLGSKNGTMLNGRDVREKPQALQDGDELRFAGILACRVELVPCPANRAVCNARSVVLTLTPERTDLGLEPIVATSFPFLVSKTDETFARYRDAYPHQVNYLSRRHAHVFAEHGEIFVEDLGSTNGTFVEGTRLEERAVRLEDGALLAFGGDHFAYRVGIRRGSIADPTLTQMQAQARTQTEAPAQAAERAEPANAQSAAVPMAMPLADMDRTTFIAAPHSFLDIFCVDPAGTGEDEVSHGTAASQSSGAPREAPRHRGAIATFIDELAIALGGNAAPDMRRIGRWGAVALALICALAATLYLRGSPQRDMRALMSAGRFDAAAQLANGYLARHPGDTAFEAAGTEALIKAKVPGWLAALKGNAFDRARALAADMQGLASHNREAAPLVAELVWMGELESFWMGRGGSDAPIRIYRDEVPITSLIARWNDDPNEHQRALEQIVSYLPAFGEPYADALSHLRQLQTDDSVYVAALERLKAAIEAALNDARTDRLDALPAMIDDYGERYPRLAGLALVRDDLRAYRQIESDARAGRAQAAAEELASIHFATPPFQARIPKLRALSAAAPRSVR
ncbi:MAG: FHA domain-containing protein [Trinickia sp.]|uniref:FHA domain-containing protein n=1 Tax=Trinickia sp. TaxID=2571163 RepID=UPI003F7E7ACA